LYATRSQNDLQTWMASFDDVQDVANGCAGWRGDQTDALRKLWQWPFSLCGKQTFRGKFLFELLKGDLERTDALHFHCAHDELVLPTRLINRHVSLQQDFLPVNKQFAVRNAFPTKKHASQLRASVLEREVNVPGILGAKVCDFSRDPD